MCPGASSPSSEPDDRLKDDRPAKRTFRARKSDDDDVPKFARPVPVDERAPSQEFTDVFLRGDLNRVIKKNAPPTISTSSIRAPPTIPTSTIREAPKSVSKKPGTFGTAKPPGLSQPGRCFPLPDRPQAQHLTGSSPKEIANTLRQNEGQNQGHTQDPQANNYGIHENDIKHDLSAGKGRPEWIFSCYAPQRDIPRQLFGGPQREQSMEEMRLRHYEAVAAGNMNQAIQEAEALWNEFNQQMNAALNDTKAAVKYVVDGANEHPNRLDIVAGKTGPVTNQGTPLGQPSAFGQPAHTSTQPSAFGQPAFGQAAQPTAQPSPFGQPAFGQPSQPSTQQSAFGKPGFGQPGFGQPAQPTGQPSPFGQPAFGQPSQPNAQPSAFGQPAFGQPSQPSVQPSPFGQPAFGQPSQPNAQPSPFGKPAFGQPSQPTGQPSAFGQPAFGQPSQPNAQPSAFGQPAFGQPSQPNTQPSAFGKPAFGQPSQSNAQPSAFGQPAFGQPSQPSTQPSAFGQPAFGQPSQPSTQPSAFGQPAFGQATQPSAPAAGAASAAPSNIHSGPRPFIKIDDPSQLNPFPPLQGETRYNPASKTLTMWKGRPVQQVQVADGNLRPVYLHPQDNKTLVRVMFPDGPPDAASLRDAEGKPEEYTPEIEEAYKFFIENGYFKDGVLPSVPPKREWVSFDF